MASSKQNKTIKKNKNDVIYKNYVLNKMGMWVQFILVILILFFILMTLFDNKYMNIVKILTGLVLIVMAYNNHKIYKRKYFTIIYSLIGILVLTVSIINLI